MVFKSLSPFDGGDIVVVVVGVMMDEVVVVDCV